MALETLQTTVRLRPTRIGFLVNPTDKKSVLRIMRYCTGLWGGRFDPIIPFSPRLPQAWRSKHHSRPTGLDLCKGYISFFEPDVFVDATGKAGVLGYGDDKLDFLRPRVCKLDEFVIGDELRQPDFAFGLSMYDVYNHLYQEEFKFVHRQEAKFAHIGRSSDVNPFFTATMGVFPDDSEISFLEQAYLEIFSPDAISNDAAGMEKLIRRGVATPLGLTSFSIEVDSGWQKDPLIFVFDPEIAADLIDYWNVRMTERYVIPVNVHWFEQASGLIREIIERNYRPLPGNQHGVMINTVLEFATSIGEEKANTLTDDLRSLPRGSWGPQALVYSSVGQVW